MIEEKQTQVFFRSDVSPSFLFPLPHRPVGMVSSFSALAGRLLEKDAHRGAKPGSFLLETT